MKAEQISIRVSPMTNTIYAGHIESNGKQTYWVDKKDVTEQVLSAVAEYMDGEYVEINFPGGTLTWTPNKEVLDSDNGGINAPKASV